MDKNIVFEEDEECTAYAHRQAEEFPAW